MQVTPEHVIYRPDRPTHLPSLRRLYLEADDPTEYSFAIKHLGSWEHWQKLCDAQWFQPYLTEWRDEMKVRIEAEAFKTARAIANTETGVLALQAAKWLHSAVQPKNTKGRPSKADVAKQAKAQAEQAKQEREDSARIGIELSQQEQDILESL